MTAPVSRRAMLKAGGALVVSFALSPSDAFGQAVATLVGSPPKELDGWLSIAAIRSALSASDETNCAAMIV